MTSTIAFTELTDENMQEERLSPKPCRFLVDFEDKYRKPRKRLSFHEACRVWVNEKCASQKLKKALIGNFPFLGILRGYGVLRDLPRDLISGMTVGIFQIPQGMAYAALATLPPYCGLYTALFAPLIYFFFGSSRYASMGCIAVVSLMIGAVLDRELDTDTSGVLNMTLNGTVDGILTERLENVKKIQITAALSFVSGLVMMALGKLGLGIVTTYMSEYLISGFTTGVAVHVVSSQMKNILGLKTVRYNGILKVIKTWIELFRNIGDTNWVPVVTSVVCIVVIYIIKTQVNERFKHKLRIPIPIELIVVIIATGISSAVELEKYFKVKVIGEIPAGIPTPRVPDVSLVRSSIVDAVIIGIIAFAQSVSMAKTLALKNKQTVNANQEMFAYGAGSVLCSVFSGYIPAASVARSVVQEGSGCVTQITSLVACCVVLVVVVALGPLMYALPSCVLSAVILVNLRSMFRQTLQLPSLWRRSKWDFSIWISTFVCVVILDADIGLSIGIVYSFLTVICRTQRGGFVSKGRVNSTAEYHSSKRYDQVYLPDYVKILTFESPLYFANAELFVQGSYSQTGIDPIKIRRKRAAGHTVVVNPSSDKEPCQSEEGGDTLLAENGIKSLNIQVETGVQCVVYEMSGVTFIDSMGATALERVISDFESVDVQVLVVGLREEVLPILQTAGFLSRRRTQLYMKLSDVLKDVGWPEHKICSE